MPKRRANGEGNIRKRKDGRWEGRYTVGHDPETGKAIIKNVLGKTQAEVKEKLKKAIEENVGIDYGKAKTYTVGGWLEVWMENYAKIKLRPSTYKTSQGFLKNHVRPQIGSIPLADLTSLDLQRFYKHLLDGGRVDRIEAKKKPKGLAPKTVRNIHQMIGSAYNLAMEQNLVSKNPTQGCALPKVEHKEMKTLTADQLSAFFQEAKDSGVYELYYLDLATGLRRGELLGLKWTDVDFQHGVLKIQRAISRQSGRGTAENEKRLPHTAIVGRRDQRSENAKVQSRKQRVGISVTNRRAHVPGQRTAYAAKSSETRGAAPHPFPRLPPHLRNHGAPKRRGRENGQQYAGSLLGGLYAGHLRPCHHGRAAQSGADHGEYPLLCHLMISAPRPVGVSVWVRKNSEQVIERKSAEKVLISHEIRTFCHV